MLQILSMSVKAFGENIRRIRSDKGFSLRKVEMQSGGKITGAYVNQIENGLVAVEDISLGKLIGLAKGLQISVDELLSEAIGKDFEKSSFLSKLDSYLIPVEYWSPEDKKLLLQYIQIFISGMNGTSHVVPKNLRTQPERDIYLSHPHNLTEETAKVLIELLTETKVSDNSESIDSDVKDLENPFLYRIEPSTIEGDEKVKVQGLQGYKKPKTQAIPVLRERAGDGDDKHQ